MNDESQKRRRRIGAAFLVLAVLLIIAGQTLLNPWLVGPTFIAYWVFCLLCTAAAMFMALLDFRSIARDAQQEHADLLRRALTPGAVVQNPKAGKAGPSSAAPKPPAARTPGP
jgi:protein-S-isoprenylcysteine O-methyltransferase Ste14